MNGAYILFMTNKATIQTDYTAGESYCNLKGNYSGQKNDSRRDLDHILNYVVESPFDMVECEEGDIKIFAPKGRLNNATRSFFKDSLYDAAAEYGSKIVFNLRHVDSIDSVGLGILIAAHKTAAERGGTMALTDMNERIFKTMKILHMDRYLNIYPDVDTAARMMS